MFSSVINFINKMGNTTNPNPEPSSQETHVTVTNATSKMEKMINDDQNTPKAKQQTNNTQFSNFQQQQPPQQQQQPNTNQYIQQAQAQAQAQTQTQSQQAPYQFVTPTSNNQQYANVYGYQPQTNVASIQSNPSPRQLQMQLETQMQQLRLLQQAQQLERQRLDLARQQRDLEAQAASQQLQQHEIIRLQHQQHQQQQAQRIQLQQQQLAQQQQQEKLKQLQQEQAQQRAATAAAAAAEAQALQQKQQQQQQQKLDAQERAGATQANKAGAQHPDSPIATDVLLDSPQVLDEKYPVIFHWSHGGRDVYVAYSGDNWSQKYRMHRSHSDFSLIMEIQPGVYHYKFIVDNQWRCAPNQKHVRDANGAYSNVLDVRSHSYQQVIDEQKRKRKREKQKAQYQYTQNLPKPDHYVQDPPICPIHLHKVILNNENDNDNDNDNDDSNNNNDNDNEKRKKNGKVNRMELPKPLRVSLNHLYVSDKREEEVVTLGMTERYKDKFFTTVYYTPIISRGTMESTFQVSNNYY